jgi:hypothetical protein
MCGERGVIAYENGSFFWELTSPWVGYLVAAENKFIKQAKLQ